MVNPFLVAYDFIDNIVIVVISFISDMSETLESYGI